MNVEFDVDMAHKNALDKEEGDPLDRLNVDILRCIFSFVPSSPKASEHSIYQSLRNSAATCRRWYKPAIEELYRDLGTPICRWDGFHAPMIIKTLKSRDLGYCVRSLHITSTLEAGLWHSLYTMEGDLLADIITLCPAVREITVASFEEASMPRLVEVLKRAKFLESFAIRVYIESWRRSSKFMKLLPYGNWSLEIVNELFGAWPCLKSFSVQHIPCDAYHMLPDPVLARNNSKALEPIEQMPSLKRAVLRETLIDDSGFRHLFTGHQLTELVIISCQGVGKGLAISRETLLGTIAATGKTLRKLEIMTPWLGQEPRHPSESQYLLDEAVKYCSNLQHLTVAGYDVSNAVFNNLHPQVRLRHLGVMDFELVTASGILKGLRNAPMSKLQSLAVWQRNDGRRHQQHAGQSLGWFEDLFVRGDSTLAHTLAKAQVAVGTGWESRLISGGEIEYHYALDPVALELHTIT